MFFPIFPFHSAKTIIKQETKLVVFCTFLVAVPYIYLFLGTVADSTVCQNSKFIIIMSDGVGEVWRAGKTGLGIWLCHTKKYFVVLFFRL